MITVHGESYFFFPQGVLDYDNYYELIPGRVFFFAYFFPKIVSYFSCQKIASECPCQNGAICHVNYCECTGGWSGEICEIPPPPCPQERLGNATYPSTPLSSSSTGVCDPGFSGSPSRFCNSDGTWAFPIGVCQLNQCPEEEAGNADWPLTDSFELALGACISGYDGNPNRTCGEDGSWGSR